jgi:hypothetical protein
LQQCSPFSFLAAPIIPGMFYRLREELEKPGSFAAWETCLHDLDSPVAQHNLRDDAFPDFEPEFQPVLLSRDSSLVDFIGSGGTVGGQGLLVSDKVLRIFARMKLPPYQPYPLEVVYRGTPIADRYFWVQILALDDYEWIDFSRSRFTLKSYFDTDDSEGAPVEIRSAKELKGVVAAKAEEKSSFTLRSSPSTRAMRDRLSICSISIAWAACLRHSPSSAKP